MTSLFKKAALVPTALLVSASTALASTGGGGGMPWDSELQTIMQDISGPTAHAIAIIAIVLSGLAMMFGESGGHKKLFTIIFGIAIAFGVSSFISALGFGSGAVIGGGSSDLVDSAWLVLAAVGMIATVSIFRMTRAPAKIEEAA